MTELAETLRSRGPVPARDLPRWPSYEDREAGVSVLRLHSTGGSGFKPGKRVEPVLYLYGEHSDWSVAAALLDANPHLVENLSPRSLHNVLGRQKGLDVDQVRNVLKNRYTREEWAEAFPAGGKTSTGTQLHHVLEKSDSAADAAKEYYGDNKNDA